MGHEFRFGNPKADASTMPNTLLVIDAIVARHGAVLVLHRLTDRPCGPKFIKRWVPANHKQRQSGCVS